MSHSFIFRQINHKYITQNVLAHRTRPKNLKRNLYTNSEPLFSGSFLSKTSTSSFSPLNESTSPIRKELIFTTPRLGSINATNIVETSNPNHRTSPPPVESLSSFEANNAPLGPLPVIQSHIRTDQRVKTRKGLSSPIFCALSLYKLLETLFFNFLSIVAAVTALLGLTPHSNGNSENGFVTPLNTGLYIFFTNSLFIFLYSLKICVDDVLSIC